MNKKSATGIGDEAVTWKKKSSEPPKQDMEGSEVRKIGRPRTGTTTSLMSSRFTSKDGGECVDPTISQSIVVRREVVSVRRSGGARDREWFGEIPRVQHFD